MANVLRNPLRSPIRGPLRSAIRNAIQGRLFYSWPGTSLESGYGNASMPVVGDNNYDRNTVDHLGIVRYLKAEEMPVVGMRRVENLLSASEDFSDASWTTIGAASVTGTNTLNFPAVNDEIRQLIPINTANTNMCFSVTLSGSGTIRIGLSNFTDVGGDIQITLTATPTRYNFHYGFNTTSSVIGRVRILRASGDTATQVTANFAQLENTTGSPSPEIPSEYVSSGAGVGAELIGDTADFTLGGGVTESAGEISGSIVALSLFAYGDGLGLGSGKLYKISFTVSNYASGSFTVILGGAQASTFPSADGDYEISLRAGSSNDRIQFNSGGSGVDASISNISVKSLDHGWNVDSVRYYTTLNPLSVDGSGIVTDTGTRTPIDPSIIKGYGPQGLAEEISGYSGDLTNAAWANTATVTQDSIGLTGSDNEAFTVTDSSAVAAQQIDLSTTIADDSSTYEAIFRTPLNASPSAYPFMDLFLQGGATAVRYGIAFDPSDGTHVLAAISGGGGTATVWRVGDFWNIKLQCINNSTGNVTALRQIRPAYNTDGSGGQDLAAQGSTVFASCELYRDAYSFRPILTTGGVTFAMPDDGSATAAVTPPVSHSSQFDLTAYFTDDLSAANMIIDLGGGKGIRFGATAKTIELYDGTNTVTVSNAWSDVGDTMAVKYYLDSDNSVMNLSVDGVLGTQGTYADITATGITYLDVERLGAVKNVRIFTGANGEGWL